MTEIIIYFNAVTSELESEEKTKEDQLFKIISNTSNLQMYTV